MSKRSAPQDGRLKRRARSVLGTQSADRRGTRRPGVLSPPAPAPSGHWRPNLSAEILAALATQAIAVSTSAAGTRRGAERLGSLSSESRSKALVR